MDRKLERGIAILLALGAGCDDRAATNASVDMTSFPPAFTADASKGT